MGRITGLLAKRSCGDCLHTKAITFVPDKPNIEKPVKQRAQGNTDAVNYLKSCGDTLLVYFGK